ncbi:MAG: hypothetical protein A3E01_13225 [Gammaproteobacteria bacterium RIFCSPHIGHO2_12_FULL_63_22]|nr:MAG: hypothetical protein A3E01_13225 [Gammaproteobacteria bacterium RIFCSPHIGHO2_12_FULL_63_22]
MAITRKPAPKADAANLEVVLPESGVERTLHAACVKAGAAAALQVALDRLPMMKPFLPRAVTDAGRGDAPERIQRLLVKQIYARYHLKPAGWEVEGILAVAQTQSVMTPLASQEGLKSVLRAWVPDSVSSPLIRYTPLEPLITATAKAVAATWAAGRYADSVCRLRRAGADWLPAPLSDALNLAPTTLRRWSAEALTLALPPLRLATTWGLRVAEFASPTLKPAAPAKKAAKATKAAQSARKKASTAARPRSKPSQ